MDSCGRARPPRSGRSSGAGAGPASRSPAAGTARWSQSSRWRRPRPARPRRSPRRHFLVARLRVVFLAGAGSADGASVPGCSERRLVGAVGGGRLGRGLLGGPLAGRLLGRGGRGRLGVGRCRRGGGGGDLVVSRRTRLVGAARAGRPGRPARGPAPSARCAAGVVLWWWSGRRRSGRRRWARCRASGWSPVTLPGAWWSVPVDDRSGPRSAARGLSCASARSADRRPAKSGGAPSCLAAGRAQRRLRCRRRPGPVPVGRTPCRPPRRGGLAPAG